MKDLDIDLQRLLEHLYKKTGISTYKYVYSLLFVYSLKRKILIIKTDIMQPDTQLQCFILVLLCFHLMGNFC